VRISRRTGLAIALLGLTIVPFAWVGLAPAKTTAPSSKQVGCGIERWSVKTLADPAGRVLRLRPKATTIRALRRAQATGYLGLRRGRGIERTTFRMRAKLVEMKLEDDSDIHLVIADPSRTGATMIAEFPSKSCTAGATPRARTKMNRARTALMAACGAPSRSFRKLNGTATISGVGFFDQIHGQTGVAPNGIELHPVVSFSGASCGGAPAATASATKWREVRRVISDGLHPTSTARSQLRRHPVPELPRPLGRRRSRPAPLRRQSRRRRLRVLEQRALELGGDRP
jgi:hypothetical protein